MALASPEKFTFDLDLGRTGRRARLYDEAALAVLLAEARETGRAEGRVEEKRAAETRAAEAAAMAARKLAAETAGFATALDAARAAIQNEAAGLAATIARKLASHLVAARPEAEILALFADCLASLDRAAHLVIRCPAELAARVKDDAERMAAEAGYAGRLIVMGEPDIASGDCRIEWADGGVARDTPAILAEIEARIRRFTDSPSEHTTGETK